MAAALDLDRSVHVWRIELASCAAEARALLSADERERAARFHFVRDRERFIAARAALRRILAGYLACTPAELAFAYAPHGKPSVPGLAFNLSHAHELALLAVTRGREVGVDIEWHAPVPELERLARVSFSAAEQGALAALADDERTAAFYRIWTRKESYIKARGEGLSMALDRFSVSLDDTADVDFAPDEAGERGRWQIHALAIDAGYTAALTISAPCPPILMRAP